MDAELLRTLVGSGGATAAVMAAIAGGWKLWQNHRAGTRAEDMDDAEWNAAYKAGAERHVLGYDVPMRQAMLDLQHVVNNLERSSGQQPSQFLSLPDPRDYPLFPKRDGDKNQP